MSSICNSVVKKMVLRALLPFAVMMALGMAPHAPSIADEPPVPRVSLDPQRLPHRLPSSQKLIVPTEEAAAAARIAPPDQSIVSASPPSLNDLGQSIDVQLPPGIRSLSRSLGGDGRKIFKWVQNNVAYTPSFGSIQGAEGCRLSLECNAHDTASLLIALLRAAGIPARYVTGQVLLDPDFFRSAMGDFVNLVEAGNFALNSGTPTAFIVDRAGGITVRMQHVWVEAFMLESNSGPSDNDREDGDDRSKQDQKAKDWQPRWVRLDAALKLNRFRPPVSAESLGIHKAPFQAIGEAATIGPNRDFVTGISADRVNAEVQAVFSRARSFLAGSAATLGDITGNLELNKEAMPRERNDAIQRKLKAYLNTRFAGKIQQASPAVAELPEATRHRLTITLNDLSGAQVLTMNRSLPELANRRLSIMYTPATLADAAIVTSGGGLYAAPSNSFMVRPQLLLDGQVVAIGAPVAMGTFQRVRITFQEPDTVSDSVDHFITAGTFAVVGLNLQRVGVDGLRERIARLRATLAQLRKGTRVAMDNVLGEVLHSQTQIYYALLDMQMETAAHQGNVRFGRRPAEMLMTYGPVFSFNQGGSAIGVRQTSMSMDFRRHILSISSRTAATQDEVDFLFGIGMYSSALEHGIFEIAQRTASVSTMQLLNTANNLGMPIFYITPSNVERIMPQLTLPAFVLDDIRQSIAAGKFVATPRSPVSFQQWLGEGYYVFDPNSGAAAYLISGGIAGGATAQDSTELNTLQNAVNTATYYTSAEPTGASESEMYISPIYWDSLVSTANTVAQEAMDFRQRQVPVNRLSGCQADKLITWRTVAAENGWLETIDQAHFSIMPPLIIPYMDSVNRILWEKIAARVPCVIGPPV